MPKTVKQPIIAIRDFKVLSIGSNLIVENPAPITNSRQTTQESLLTDQSILDLGMTHNTGLTTDNVDANKVKLQFTAYLNDHNNVTDGAKFWIGAGVIGRPKMVWVGQIQITANVTTNEPKPHVNMAYSADTYVVVNPTSMRRYCNVVPTSIQRRCTG